MQTAPEPTQAPRAPAPVWRRRARALATLALLLALGWLGRRHAGDLDRLAAAKLGPVFWMAVSVVLARWIFSDIARHTLATLGHPIARFEVFALTVLSAVPNLLVPRTGFGALGVALRARHGVPLAVSGSLLLPLSVLDLVVVAAAGLIVQATLIGFTPPHSGAIAATFAGVFAVACAALFPPVRVPFAPAPLREFLARLGDAWAHLRGSRGFALRSLALLFAITALQALRLGLAFEALGATPHFAGLVLASLVGDLMFVLALTPGALGLREAAIVYCADLAGVTPAASLAAAVLDRIVMTVVLLALAQLAAWRLFGSGRDRRP